jgi:HK97 family phage major capsid protein
MPLNSDPDLLPIEWSRDVIKQMEQTSVVMALSQTRGMTTRQQRLPATSALASAFWVGSATNDFSNLKQETQAAWRGVELIVEELACLVAIPHAYTADNNFPVWEETRPQLVEAMGIALDAAVLFGVDKPTSWQEAIYPSIVQAGQTVEEGTTTDLAADVAESARLLKSRGFDTTGWAAEPGMQWRLIGMRSTDGTPIYQPNLTGPISTGLYGRPIVEVSNGAWDATDALMIHGDWRRSIVGIRQDITFTRHTDGIISNAAGEVVYNAMQQDSDIWRAVFRVAWARANPATRLGPDANESGDQATVTKFPWAAIVPAVGS